MKCQIGTGCYFGLSQTAIIIVAGILKPPPKTLSRSMGVAYWMRNSGVGNGQGRTEGHDNDGDEEFVDDPRVEEQDVFEILAHSVLHDRTQTVSSFQLLTIHSITDRILG